MYANKCYCYSNRTFHYHSDEGGAEKNEYTILYEEREKIGEILNEDLYQLARILEQFSVTRNMPNEA